MDGRHLPDDSRLVTMAMIEGPRPWPQPAAAAASGSNRLKCLSNWPGSFTIGGARN